MVTTMMARALIAALLVVRDANAAVAPTSSSHERFAVMKTSPPHQGYLMPRAYYAIPGFPIEKRQGSCPGDDMHPCAEIGPPGERFCCPNNHCIVNVTNPSEAACCRIGSTCGSPCSADKYQCQVTVTRTSSNTPVTTTSSACCHRRCPQTSYYGCPLDFGGACCPHGQTCGTSSLCLSTIPPSTSPLLTPVPSGCSQGQITCASSLGGGCCPNTLACSQSDGSPVCAMTTVIPTGSGISSIDRNEASSSSDLSVGAKAGIAVGVVIAAGILIGLATWLWHRRRKQRRTEAGAVTSASGAGGGGDIPRIIGTEDGRGGVPTASEIQSGRVPFGTQEYYGPEAQPGPYSDPSPDNHNQFYQNGYGSSPNPQSASTTPGVDQQAYFPNMISPIPAPSANFGGQQGVLPVMPNDPGEIQRPVEIAEGGVRRQGTTATGVTAGTGVSGVTESSDVVAGGGGGVGRSDSARFELYGSDPGQLSPRSLGGGEEQFYTPDERPPPPGGGQDGGQGGQGGGGGGGFRGGMGGEMERLQNIVLRDLLLFSQ
ncbi:hypothetical protein B0T21DRAFT_430740 [Apiosordaria backusii]|uniref:Uncharacterized protein n=1 Tax=Apiosordaria backusii TaxID=314023 RepID=A0AA40K498_9PEZI|nr:hypothetical protein B0T21DRAFT_430740 [Apiosordaria backusii]